MVRVQSQAVVLLVVVLAGSWARAETRRGLVLASDGSPAKGARVWAANLNTQKLQRVEGTADDRGRFGLDLGPGRWILQASLGDQGLKEMDVLVEQGKANRPLILRLSPQGRLRVRMVEAESGKPIAGGRLVLDNGLDPKTDADGRLEMSGLSRARYHESFVVAPGRERKRVLFEMSDHPVTELELAVPRGGKAVGRVLDTAGNPIPGARVGRATSGSILSLTGLWVGADEQGRYTLDGLPLERTTWLNASAEGFEGVQEDAVHADSGGGPLSIDFHLTRIPAEDPAGSALVPATPVRGGLIAKDAVNQAAPASRRNVSGVVLDPDGKPVPDALVRWGPMQSDDSIEARTGPDGAFRLAQVPDQVESVCVIPEKANLAPEISQVSQRGDQQVRITLTRGHFVSGVVHDDRGTPFAGVTVVPIVAGAGRRDLALWQRSARTDDQGHFRVDGLPGAGTNFTFLGHGVSDLRDQALKLDGENSVVMWAAGAIRGRVVDQQGKPVRNFRVLLNGSRERKDSDKNGGFFAGFCGIGLSYTSADGSFLVRNLGGGSVQRVTVLAPGYGEASIDRVVAEPLSHQTTEQAVVFRLTPPNTLRVRAVEEHSGKPIPVARVGLIYDDPSIDQNFMWGYHDTAWGDSVHGRTDAQGVATFSPLSFAEATVLVQAPGHARRHLGWRDRATDIVVKLPREAVVSGELLDDRTGKPLSGVSVRLQSAAGGMRTVSLQPGDAGRFRLGELEAGSYLFLIMSESGASLRDESLKLEAGQHVERTLRLSTAGK
jgi:protocatechuate 3,4-dioxygenase beta subunit